MTIADTNQMYQILKSLTNFETSFNTYAKSPMDFAKYDPYLEYLKNPVIKKNRWSRLYFPYEGSLSRLDLDAITDLHTISDQLTIVPDYSMSLAKQFNFKNNIRHKCNYYSALYMLEGTAELVVAGKSFHLEKGSFFIIAPNFYYSIGTTDESICIFFNLRKSYIETEYPLLFHDFPILTKYFLGTFQHDHELSYIYLNTSGSEGVTRLVLRLFLEYLNQESYSNSVMKNYFALFIVEIMRDPQLKIDSPIEITPQEQLYQQILEYLKKNYRRASLDDLVHSFHFSKQYICRIIKKYSQTTFSQLLQSIKLDVAKQYLLETDLTLETISAICGYSSASHLSKEFKKAYQMAPKFYRLRYTTNR